MKPRYRAAVVWGAIILTSVSVVSGCGQRADKGSGGRGGLSGTVQSDGSSTVFPITEAMAEEFGNANSGVKVTVGVSGTGGGFEKFCNGETDMQNASRAIKDEEVAKCKEMGVDYTELLIAYDGLSVMVNPSNDFIECLTTAELKKVWKPGSTVKTWKDVRGEWPSKAIKLYGPGTDSGTFDFFTKEINGEERASRSDYTASEDDNVLVQGIAGDKNALGYFGFAYYKENRDKLKLVAVDGGKGCVKPSKEAVLSGDYAPLSRPLYVYVRNQSLSRPEVAEFTKFYVAQAKELVPAAGYIEVPEKDMEKMRSALDASLAAAE